MIEAWFDGSATSLDDTGANGIGWIVYQNGAKMAEQSTSFVFGPPSTNNVAEYAALKDLLNYLFLNNFQDEEIVIYGDSQLVINQTFGKWKMRGGVYKPFAEAVHGLVLKFSNIRGKWVSRSQNEGANKLASEAYQKRRKALEESGHG